MPRYLQAVLAIEPERAARIVNQDICPMPKFDAHPQGCLVRGSAHAVAFVIGDIAGQGEDVLINVGPISYSHSYDMPKKTIPAAVIALLRTGPSSLNHPDPFRGTGHPDGDAFESARAELHRDYLLWLETWVIPPLNRLAI